jgi:stage II sporulation protein D
MRRLATISLSIALAAALAAPAGAASRFTVRGAGYGHGIGMSQYGAYGFAKRGSTYREILAHYYTGTSLGTVSPGREIRVLLQSGRRSASFTGATSAGTRSLDPSRVYSVTRYGAGEVTLRSARGRKLARLPAPLRVSGPGAVVLRGVAGNGLRNGRYRGALTFSPGVLGGVDVVNAVGLENYIRGVIAAESPSSWPAAALQAQAVAARTYAITTGRSGAIFDQYPDTRSQVYRGVASETATTNAAAEATRSEVVTYDGKPVVTYFFSTSGGHTENVENSFIGATPRPWLKGVKDPYDKASPKHRWGPMRMSLKRAGARLRGYVKGSFRGIDVTKRGTSPRVVYANVIGSKGRTRVTGPQLRARLGLFDTWAYFTTITSDVKRETPESKPPESDPSDPSGGTPPDARAAVLGPRVQLTGRILPAGRRVWVRVQRYTSKGFRAEAWTLTDEGGRYRASVKGPGRYRVALRGGVVGPVVSVPASAFAERSSAK